MKTLIVALLGLVAGLAVLLLVWTSGEDAPNQVELAEFEPPSNEKLVEASERHLMDFDDVPLSEIVRVLNQSNATQIEFADPEIGELRITATLRSGNSDVFVNLLELTLDVRAERVNESKLVLHLKQTP